MKASPFIIFLVFFLLVIPRLVGHALEVTRQSATHVIAQQPQTPQSFEHYAQFNINNISSPVGNNGSIGGGFDDPNGFEWPKGSGLRAIHDAGLWLGAKVDNSVRVAVNWYSRTFQPGSLNDSTHLPWDPNDSTFRVYRIQWGDSSSSDYMHWPSQLGAPVTADGRPHLLGQQTLWSVFNDADSILSRRYPGLPLGVEVQHTVFGFNNIGGLFDNLMIVRYLILNKSGNTLDSMYFGFWSDPDLGDAADDANGCDSALSLWYCYNLTDPDAIFGTHPPAIGYVTLQGPKVVSSAHSAKFMGRLVDGFENLPMTSFVSWPNDFTIDGNPQTAQEAYYRLSSRWRNGQGITYGGRGIDLLSQRTQYMYSGDPESGSGWLATYSRHQLSSMGPFTMAPGDTQEVVMGILVSKGTSNFNSVTKLKNETGALHSIYSDSLYKLFAPPGLFTSPEIPELYRLSQNYPNPFNPETEIQFDLPRDEQITLAVYNTLGQRVAVLASGFHLAGRYTVRWEPGSAASGVYFYQLDAGRYVKTRRMILLK